MAGRNDRSRPGVAAGLCVTLCIEFRGCANGETGNLDENTTIDMDAEGNLLAITFEHAHGPRGT